MTFLSLVSHLCPTPSSLWPASGADVFRLCQYAFLTSPLMVPIFRVVQAPFGRFSIPSPFNLPGNLAWFLMEIPSPITFALALASQPLKETASLSPLSLRDVLSPSLSRLAQLPAANLLLAALFLTHYFQRAVISPLRAPPRSPLHLLVASLAVIFNLINGFMLGSWVGGRSPQIHLPSAAFTSSSKLGDSTGEKLQSLLSGSVPGRTIASPGLLPTAFSSVISNPIFLLAIAGWAVGFASNVYHDEILSDLRRPKERRVTRAMVEDADKAGMSGKDTGPKYGIPRGGLYKWVSYPNYLSEWFEWSCFVVACYSLGPLSPLSAQTPVLPLTLQARLILFITSPPFLFLLAEFCPMLPRAISGHRWYHDKFGVEGDGKDGKYPKERWAVIPGLV